MGEMDIPLFPFSKVACDFVGPLSRTLSNNAYILHFHDLFSGWMMCFATPDKSSDTVCSILVNEVLTQHSHILCLLTDNGKELTSGKMIETLAALNIKHITTSFYSPQANGAAEKAHLTLMNVLSKKIQVILRYGIYISVEHVQQLISQCMSHQNSHFSSFCTIVTPYYL